MAARFRSSGQGGQAAKSALEISLEMRQAQMPNDGEIHVAAGAGQRLHAGRRRRQHRRADRRRRRAGRRHGHRADERQAARRDQEAVRQTDPLHRSTRTSIPITSAATRRSPRPAARPAAASPTIHRARKRAEPDERAGRQAGRDGPRRLADRHVLPRGEGHLLQRRSGDALPRCGGAHRRRHHRVLPPLGCRGRRRHLRDHELSGHRCGERRQRPGRDRRPEPHPRPGGARARAGRRHL